jgi:hypothetical protein
MAITLPIKIKSIRKPKFTTGTRHRAYSAAPWKWDTVIREAQSGEVKQVANKYGIKYSTLVKRLARAKSEGVESAAKDKREATNRAKHAVFTVQEERALYDSVISNYIDKGKPFVNEDLQHTALDFFQSLRGTRVRGSHFTASVGWVSAFKKRWRLSSRRPGKSHRVTVPNPYDLRQFQERLLQAYDLKAYNRLLNFDETRINVVPAIKSSFSIKGADSLHLKSNSDPHAAFTAGMTISADGGVLPMFIVSSESMERALNSGNADLPIESKSLIQSSARSYMTSGLMVKYLEFLRAYFDGEEEKIESQLVKAGPNGLDKDAEWYLEEEGDYEKWIQDAIDHTVSSPQRTKEREQVSTGFGIGLGLRVDLTNDCAYVTEKRDAAYSPARPEGKMGERSIPSSASVHQRFGPFLQRGIRNCPQAAKKGMGSRSNTCSSQIKFHACS